MTATTGFTSIGALLKLGDAASPESFNEIGNVTNFTLTQSADQIDATHLSSTSGYREFKQGYKSASVSFEGHFDPDNTTQGDTNGIIAAFNAGTARNFKADFSAADNAGSGAPTSEGVCSFSGVITEFTVNTPTGDMVTFTGTISMSSSPAWATT